MFKKTISFFLLLFLTQTVLAGIDLHHPSVNNTVDNKMIDILDHYIDTHSLDYSVNHQCDSASNTISSSLHADGSLLADGSLPADGSTNIHHHDCHGHLTPYSFIYFSLIDANHGSFFTCYTYILSDYSVTISLPKRPPILT